MDCGQTMCDMKDTSDCKLEAEECFIPAVTLDQILDEIERLGYSVDIFSGRNPNSYGAQATPRGYGVKSYIETGKTRIAAAAKVLRKIKEG